ncbi:MAG: glycosyltransferase family 2 protein [Paracoccaceae bacterium]
MNRNLKEFVNQHEELRAAQEGYGARHIAILLAHYNGADVLAEQLQSLSAQTHRDWSLVFSDDGSSDSGIQIARDFRSAHPNHRIWLAHGPRKGFVQNFLGLLTMAGPSVPYAAFCDQDDVWSPAKLETALKALRSVKPGQPALYCSRTMITDEKLTPQHASPLFSRPPSFQNALVQNVGGGNTMVMNRAALDLLQDTMRHAKGVVSHDWWAYQLISGAGGSVIYDPTPQLLYRQHGKNIVGSNAGRAARLKRLNQLFKGQFKKWNDANIQALRRSQHWLTPEAVACLDTFQSARCGGVFARLSGLKRSGVYRQTRVGQAGLWMAAVCNKF